MESESPNEVAVIGAGLVGTLHSIYLAKHGYHVRLYEGRGDVRATRNPESLIGRSVNLTLSMRGQEALKAVGLEAAVLQNAIPVRGRMVHEISGSTYSQAYGTNGECIYSVNRQNLLQLLLNEAEEFDNIDILFSHKLDRIDFAHKELTLSTDKGEQIREKMDFCFGCDGAFSTVRRQMDHFSGVNYTQHYIDAPYKQLNIPPNDNGEHALECNYLHVWPRGEFVLIALPNLDYSFTATLFMPKEKFKAIDDQDKLLTFFNDYFPDAVPLIGEERLVADYLENRERNFKSIKCDTLYTEGVLLMGDAAHAMVPFYGQGMNTGFEDCLIFSELLQQHGKNLHKAVSQYAEERCKDTHVIVDLALENYIKLRSRVNSSWYHLERKFEEVLYWLFPNDFKPQYSMVAFTRIPYSTVVAIDARRKRIVKYGPLLILIISFYLLTAFIFHLLSLN